MSIFSLDDLRAWARHSDPNVRRWAVSRWIERHPSAYIEELASHLLDDDPEIPRDVGRLLARSGDPKWIPVLRKALELADGMGRVGVVEALSELSSADALPDLVRLVRTPRSGEELVAGILALGNLRDPRAREQLARLLQLAPGDDPFGAAVVVSLLRQGHREDVDAVVRRWVSWAQAPEGMVLEGLAFWLGIDDTTARISQMTQEYGPSTVLTLLGDHHRVDGLLDEVLEDLDEAWSRGAAALLEACHAAVPDALAGRPTDLSRWAREPIPHPAYDFAHRAVATEALLAAMSRHVPEARAAAAVPLAVAALCSLACREDDDARLGPRGRYAEALRLLRAPWPVVSPRAGQIIAKRGVRAIPDLVRVLAAPSSHEPARARASMLLDTLSVDHAAALHPHVDALIDGLAAASGASWIAPGVQALRRVGPTALRAASARLGADDPAREVALEVIAGIPEEASFDALAQAFSEDDDAAVEALADLGDPRAVPLLAEAWRPGNLPLASILSSLSEMHGIDHPDASRWQAELFRAAGQMAWTHAAMRQAPAES